jgi:hypothetical protein
MFFKVVSRSGTNGRSLRCVPHGLSMATGSFYWILGRAVWMLSATPN